MPQQAKVHPAIEFVHGLFDIVGKTVDNVIYSPEQHGESALVVIRFTDKTALHITGERIRATLKDAQ